MNAEKAPPRPRLELFSGSLPGRVLWFTATIVFLAELFLLLPRLGQTRLDWMHAQADEASQITAIAAADPAPATLAAAQAALASAGMHQVRLDIPGKTPLILDAAGQIVPPHPGQALQLERETLGRSIWHVCRRLAGFGVSEIRFSAASASQPGATVTVQMSGANIYAIVKRAAWQGLILAVAMALVTGLLVFTALEWLLVRPMRLITASMRDFREDPEASGGSALAWLASRPEGEISGAARELKSLQETLRAALWRNARLAAVGIAVAKIAHDLRNTLSAALLVADRLDTVPDEQTRRAAATLVQAVERAAQLVTRTMDFTREGPPPITRAPLPLAALADEAAQSAWPDGAGPAMDNEIPPTLTLPLDRTQFHRVLANLLRNAAEAGATRLRLTAETQNGMARLHVADNGPGLPPRARENLFKPFSGSARANGTGLGLAIARDLVRAHGGELTLERTGPEGAVFLIELPISQ